MLNPAQQHTFVCAALAIADSTMTVLKPALDAGNQKDQCARIFRWISDCSATVKPRKESAGSRRWIKNFYTRVKPYLTTDTLDDDARLAAWARNLWLATALIADVTAVCPDFYRPHKRKWEYLYRTMTTLCVRFLQCDPHADTEGMLRYMDVMEGFNA